MESPNFSNHGRSSLVLFTPDLILLIFEALAEPCAAEDKSTTNYLPRCMLVCREWYYIVRKMIWSHLTKPHKAFDAVLFQYDSLTDLLSSKDLFRRRPGIAYERYRHHAEMVRSISNYTVEDSIEDHIMAAFNLLLIHPSPFIRLESLEIQISSGSYCFPRVFQSGSITHISIQFPYGYSLTRRTGLLHQVAETCPKLERLALKTELCLSQIDFLRPVPFPHLQNLSLCLKQTDFDEIMGIILSVSHRITDLELHLTGKEEAFLPKRFRSHPMIALRTLILDIDNGAALTTLLRAFPRAPNLRRCTVTTKATLSSTTCNTLFRSVEEYSHSSPFYDLTLTVAGVYDLAFTVTGGYEPPTPLNIIPLLRIQWLEYVSLCIQIGPTPQRLHPSQIDSAWRRLRSMNLAFGEKIHTSLNTLLEEAVTSEAL